MMSLFPERIYLCFSQIEREQSTLISSVVEQIRNTVSASEAGPLLTRPYHWGSTCQPGGTSRIPSHWQTLNPKSCLPSIVRLLKSRCGFSATDLPLSAGLLGFSAANKLANTSREKQQRTPGSSLCGSEGLRIHPVVLSSVLRCTITMYRLRGWQKPNQEDRKEQVETPESAPTPRQIREQIQTERLRMVLFSGI